VGWRKASYPYTKGRATKETRGGSVVRSGEGCTRRNCGIGSELKARGWGGSAGTGRPGTLYAGAAGRVPAVCWVRGGAESSRGAS